MMNVELRSGYNLQFATNGQFTLKYRIFSNPTDMSTLVLFLSDMYSLNLLHHKYGVKPFFVRMKSIF